MRLHFEQVGGKNDDSLVLPANARDFCIRPLTSDGAADNMRPVETIPL
jgi:hypothetical protein